MQDLEDEENDAFTEQRRVRHLTEVLVRNLSIPAAFVNSDTSGSSSLRPLYGRSAFSSSGATAASSVAGPSSGSSLTERFPTYAPPGRSKDDLDLYIPALHRRRSGRRKLTVSHGAKTPSSTSDGTAKDIDQPSGNGVPAGRRLDVKGKGRESSLASSRETLNSIQESETSDAARPIVERELEVDDSDVVFGWTSASRQPVPLHLERSKSKSSLKSSSSKRSISSSVSKRFFKQNRRRRSSLIGSEDEDDDEDSEGSQAHSPRRTTSSKDERPASPMSPHVSFQMASDHGHAWSSGIDFASDLPNSVSAASRRARSASRGSVFSVASGSSASTIRASAAFKHSEKEERFLRWKRYEDIRAHLVRSRLVLCIPQTLSMDTENLDTSLRPPMTRTRTISLPLRSNSGRDTVRSSPSNSGKRTPFYISEPHKKSMEPSFPLEFSTADSSSVESSNASKCHRIIVQIWIESPDNSPFENQGKNDTGWNLLLEWDVDLRRLISLGTDPRLFPRHLPANTLIFRTANTDEYLTARLPSFMLSDPLGDNEELPLKDVRPNDGSHEEEGNVSDPGPASSFRPKRGVSQGELSFKQDDGRERERLLARRRMILDRSVRETRMVQSVDDEELRRIILREQEIRKGRAEIHELRSRLDTLLVAEPFRSERQHNSRSVSLQELEGGKSRLADLETAGRSQCTRKRELLATRRSHLKKARDIFQAKEQALRKSKAYHLLDMDVYRSILLSISQRRAGLISELSTIFPVELVDAANVLFSICGVPLPNGDSIQASLQTSTGLDLDEDHISSALGYVAQAVQLLAAYLTIPLYYPIKCMGSRSLVQDPISQMKGPKIFPLYSKGVDRYRFEYAVFLLNKDIEQIMLEHSIGVMDLTQTLPNLKNIYLTLSSDAIMSTRKDATPSGVPVKPAQPILLPSESKPAKAREEPPYETDSTQTDSMPMAQSANGSIVSHPHGTTISTLEKLLGSGWPSRSKAHSGSPTSVVSPVKGRRRNAEASKTMTLLGGKSSLNVTH